MAPFSRLLVEPLKGTAKPLKPQHNPERHGRAAAHELRMGCARKAQKMTAESLPDLLNGYDEIGAHLGMTERQAEHLRENDPTFPTFKLGRKVCALRSKVDRWLADKAARASVEGGAP